MSWAGVIFIWSAHRSLCTTFEPLFLTLKARISQQLAKFNAELQSLGGPQGDSSSNVVLSVITEFTSEFRTTIDGNTNDLSLNELSGGARISFVFHELFNNGIKNIDPFDQVKDGDIRTMLYNSSASMETPVVKLLTDLSSGFHTSIVRGHDGLWGDCEAADQAVGRAGSKVLPAHIWWAHPYVGTIAR